MPRNYPISIFYPSNNFKNILKGFSKESVILLDLDNTVMETTQELGSDQWFGEFMRLVTSKMADKKEASQLALAIYWSVQHQAKMQLVEEDIATIIRSLQQSGMQVLALTSRGRDIVLPTLKQLQGLGIDFSNGKVENGVFLELGDSSASSACMVENVIFCNGKDKGEVLKAYFNATQCFPKEVFMADDKKKYLDSVEKIVHAYGGNFVGMRYGYLDQKVKELSMDNAMAQLRTVQHLLQDKGQKAVEKLTQSRII